MQDENTIEGQLSPRPKAKSEMSMEGMPPQKTQKLSHVPSNQLLDLALNPRIPLHTVDTNTKPLSRTHPISGKGKEKQTHEKRLFAKSQSAPGAENTSHLHQTRLNLQPINKQRPTSQPQQRPEDEDAVSEQDLELVKSLEDALDRVKESVENLQRQVNKETHNLETMRRVFQEEEDDVAMKIRIVESEIQDLECTIEDQEADIKKKGEHILQLGIEIESKEVEIAELQEQLEEFEEETMRLLSGGDLLDLNEDINELEAAIDDGMEVMAEMKVQIDEAEEGLRKLLSEEASYDEALQGYEILIEEYEAELESEGTDLQMSKAHAIEVEFDALKRQYMVAKGSAVDRETTEYQARLRTQYEQEHASLQRRQALSMELIKTRTISHEEQLSKYRQSIKSADARIACARENSGASLMRHQQVEAMAEAVRKEIEDVWQQLGQIHLHV